MAVENIAGLLLDGSPFSTEIDRNPRRTIRLSKGTDLQLVLDVTNPQGAPVDLSLVVPIALTVRKNPEPFANIPPVISRVGIIAPGSVRGRTTFSIVPADTINLPPGQYVWDVKAKLPPGKWNSLVGASPFHVEPAVGYPDAPLTAPGGVTFYYAFPPLIASLALLGTNPRELGQSLVNPSFTAAYNRPASAVSLTDGTHTVSLVSPFTSGTLSFTYNGLSIGSLQAFTLTASEANGPNLTAVVTVLWQPRVFWGSSAVPGSYNEPFIEGLSFSALQAGRQASPGYSASAGQKLYYCLPSAFGGVPGNFVNASTGISVGMSKVAAGVSVTNPFGVSLPYDVWESDISGLGAITLLVG